MNKNFKRVWPIGCAVLVTLLFISIQFAAFEPCTLADNVTLKTVKDSVTGLTFQYPSNLRIEHDDNWAEVPTDGLHGTEGVYWNVFSTDYFTGTIRERAENWASRFAADGIDGGAATRPIFLGTEKAQSGDVVLLFQLKVHGYGHSSNWEGRIAGYVLAVDLKPDGKRKYRHFLLYAPSESVLRQIGKLIEIPLNISALRS